VVVSAFQEVTDSLKRISEMASAHNVQYKEILEVLVGKHGEICTSLLTGDRLTKVMSKISVLFDELKEILDGIFLLRELSTISLDKVLSMGERLSSGILASFFNDAVLIDARGVIKTDDNFGHATVDFEITNSLIRKRILRKNRLFLMPGFIASTHDNETTTLGRGGSDYTAAIVAAAVNAEVLEIWTDTDGFMTADPKKVEKAYTIENLTYSEAIELSHFGAKVIYTPTLRPVYRQKIPVVIKNSFNPHVKGTLISDSPKNGSRSPIKGISSIDHIDLITLQGPSMVGVTGTSMRLFSSLAKRNINIILITQASSEYWILRSSSRKQKAGSNQR
jgi:aspartokinase/homoserine dehydrogenase 1